MHEFDVFRGRTYALQEKPSIITFNGLVEFIHQFASAAWPGEMWLHNAWRNNVRESTWTC